MNLWISGIPDSKVCNGPQLVDGQTSGLLF